MLINHKCTFNANLILCDSCFFWIMNNLYLSFEFTCIQFSAKCQKINTNNQESPTRAAQRSALSTAAKP